MDIREMRYFARVAQDGNFSVAASKLDISQPALSKVIKKMEDEVGAPLFHMFQRRQRLTDVGELLLKKVARVINEYDGIVESNEMDKMIYQGQVYLGIPPIAGTCYFSEFLAGFSQEYPGIKLRISEEGTERIRADVSAGLLDVGCVSAPVSDSLFDHVRFVRDPYCLVVGTRHPLAGRTSVRLEELKQEAFILSGEEYAVSHTIRAACCEVGFEPNVALISSRWDFIVQLVQQDYGIAIQPRSLFDRFLFPGVCVVQLDHPAMEHSLELITKRNAVVFRSTNCFTSYVMRQISGGGFRTSFQEPITYIG